MAGTIGIVGAGSIVERYYLHALRQLGYADILIYDKIEVRSKELAQQFGVRQADIATIQQAADTIIIATPPHTHFDLVNQLLACNKTIICEKPFVLSQEHALLLNTKAQQIDANLLVAHIRRIFPGIQLAQQYIEQHQQELGKLQRVLLNEGARFNYKSQSGYVRNHPMGGVLADTGSHVLDCLLYATGLDLQPISCTLQSVEHNQPEPSHEVTCAFQINDIPVQLRLSRYQALSNKMTLQYEHATIDVPLGIKPNIRVIANQTSTIHSAATSCLTYFSQAFREELRLMLQQPDEHRFDAKRFLNLSAVLETLYKA
ncbi:MAG: Gfo/Idh/MocA family oxidoreductase [Bacteroidota bacterium]